MQVNAKDISISKYLAELLLVTLLLLLRHGEARPKVVGRGASAKVPDIVESSVVAAVGPGVALGVRRGVVPQDAVDGAQEGVLLAAANVVEVIQVQSPDHGSAVALGLDELGLAAHHGHVVVAHPLVALEGVGTQGLPVVVHHSPTLALDLLAYLRLRRRQTVDFSKISAVYRRIIISFKKNLTS